MSGTAGRGDTAGRQTGRQRVRQTCRWKGRQTERHTETNRVMTENNLHFKVKRILLGN
jgi:hypothetical protein